MRIGSRGVWWVCGVVACWLAAGSGYLRAQAASGELTGIVKDQAGSPVPGVTVTVIEIATNRQHVVITTREGVYSAPSLRPGQYRIDVALNGFKPIRREGIGVHTGEKARLDFVLEVGNVREQVIVEADAPMLRAETASLGTVINNDKVVQLPLNGRTFIQLATLAPGGAAAGFSAPCINGGRPRTNEHCSTASRCCSRSRGRSPLPVIDSIEEFVETNSPPAEFGRFNGGVVN